MKKLVLVVLLVMSNMSFGAMYARELNGAKGFDVTNDAANAMYWNALNETLIWTFTSNTMTLSTNSGVTNLTTAIPVTFSGGATLSGTNTMASGATLGVSKICTATVTLTATQIKALYTTAIPIVGAQGTHTTIEVLGCSLFYNYSGGACTIGSATNLALKYVDKSGTACSGTLAVTGLLDQTVDLSAKLLPAAVAASAVAINENVPVCLTLAGADVTGAATTSTLTCTITYVVHNTGF
jgi:hypothetical protein